MNNLYDLAHKAGQSLQARGWQLATAESCTGGLVGGTITTIAGSSAYYLGGVISYSNDVKMAQLGVPLEIIMAVGAVSAECAQAMAEGVRTRFGADIAVATTGIAGPGGATPDKPVGLVYVAVATPTGTQSQRCLFTGDRITNQQATVEAALAMIIESCIQI
ncbi:MAG: CinA family protein [Herpetosiphonaceae bacterium]|nr:CinA family protein [Herpetosiphonaceae bacterium]